MTNIIHVPIEPITERYTEQWYRRFPEAFASQGFTVVTVDGVTLLDNEIKVGAFLDINSTVHYKMVQLQKIAAMFHHGMIQQGTVFFFGDVEFWGIESVRLLAQMNGIKVYITGFLHAASYTREDAFSVAEPYQRYTEVGWMAALDQIYVGSEYHRNQVIRHRLMPVNASHLIEKLVVTKNPLFRDEYHTFPEIKEKKRKVLLTNRFDKEKRPLQTIQLFERLQRAFSHWEFVITTGRPTLRGDQEAVDYARDLESKGVLKIKAGLTKEEYHRELAEAHMVVTHSIEENYGYCVAEAIHYGCWPLMRFGLSHNEFIAGSADAQYCLFGDELAALENATTLMNKFGRDAKPNIPLDYNGMARIIAYIKALVYQ